MPNFPEEDGMGSVTLTTENQITAAVEKLLYSAEQAGRRLLCSPNTIRSYWSRGLLERVKVGSLSRVSEKGILEFLDRSKAASVGRPHNAGLAVEGLRRKREEDVRKKREAKERRMAKQREAD
jgi:hypothetical protein